MTRATMRFRLAMAVLTLDALLMAALVGLAIMGKHVSGDNILFMAVGVVLGWGGMVLAFYFGTSESSVQKNELLGMNRTDPEGD